MKIYPAIDLIGGQVVRLSQGRFDQKTTYGSDPLAVARAFAESGATYLHIVDLDGAREAAPQQLPLLEKLAQESGLRMQAGGGVRKAEHIEALLQAGVERVVIGSLAIHDQALTQRFFEQFSGDRLTLGLDVQLDAEGVARVATHGWQELSPLTAEEVLKRYLASGLQQVLCTDISKDGMLKGPNFDLYSQLQKQFPSLTFLASGGVRGVSDISQLKAAGIGGAIIGKALYEGGVRLEDVLASAR